jgi:hypothetical protein
VDQINDELARIVRFLNACSSANFEFAALEMRRFTAEGSEMLVPRVFGPTQVIKRAAPGPSRQWDEAAFFEELQHRHGDLAVSAARRILEWSASHMDTWWGSPAWRSPRAASKDAPASAWRAWPRPARSSSS